MSDQIKKTLEDGAMGDFSEENCISDALLLQFIEGTATAEDTTRIQAHLNECAICSHIVGSVYYNRTHPFTEEERREAKELVKHSPEKQVEKLLRHLKAAGSPHAVNGAPKTVPQAGISKRFRLSLDWFPSPPLWQPAFAVLLTLLALGGRWTYRYVQTDYKIQQAAKLLREEHRIFYEDVRLSGGYASKGAGMTMGPGDSTSENQRETYIDRAQDQVKQAISNGATRTTAEQLLFQISMMSQDQAAADTLARVLEPLAPSSAALANDLGVYYFQRKEWRKAEEYFTEACANDPKMLEAYFNLAHVKAKLGEREEAFSLLERYLLIEPDDGWKRAALSLKQALQKVSPE